VNGFLLHDSKDEDVKLYGLKMAIDYFKLAEHYLHDNMTPFNPVVIMGLSGSGKSAITEDFAHDWIILRSDEIRKQLAGIKKDMHVYTEYGTGIYTEEMTDKIYSFLLDEALRHAKEGKRVVVDATYLQSKQRMDFYSACMAGGFNPFFIHCFASEKVLRERINKRMEEGANISDADIKILERQIEDREEPVELPYFRVLRLNTEDALHNTVSALKEFL
jgi:predicted kinase